MAVRSCRVIGLRGDVQRAPENSLPAFDAALALGTDELACDVRQTKDGVAVLLRDAALQRLTGREAPVRDLTLKEIQALEPPAQPGQAAAPARVPTLEEFVAKYVPSVPVQIELTEPAGVLPAVQVLQRYQGAGAFERVLLASFQRVILSSVRVLDGRVRLGYMLEPHSPETIAEVKHFGAAVVLPHWEEANKGYVDDAHKLGLLVQPWGVENLEAAKQVVAAGVDAVSLDRPGELLAYLKEAKLRTNGGQQA